MIEKYEKIFNSPDSLINVDKTWDFHNQGIDRMKDRFDYSIPFLHGDVLELGAGDGYFAFLAAQSERVKHVTAVEIQDKAIERIKANLSGKPYANSKVTVVKDIIETMDLGRTFDSIHCGHTLEHVHDLERCMESIQKHAGDRVVISVPIYGGRSRQHLREWTHADQFRKIVDQYFDEVEYKEFQKKGRRTSLVIIAKAR